MSGHAEAIEAAIKIVAEMGLRIRCTRLTVGGPFHTSLMEPAEEVLQTQLASIKITNPKYPIISNVTAQEVTNADSISSLLVKQLCSPVQWYNSVQYATNHGVKLFLEIGPDRILTSLIRQIDPNIRCM